MHTFKFDTEKKLTEEQFIVLTSLSSKLDDCNCNVVHLCTDHTEDFFTFSGVKGTERSHVTNIWYYDNIEVHTYAAFTHFFYTLN